MHRSIEAFPDELTLQLTAQELLAPPTFASMVEIDDICAVDPLLRTEDSAANADRAALEDASQSVEIELTAQQIEAMLTGKTG
jgi:hypothetical protein